MTAYYNEHDPGAAAWLRELIRCGLIAPGDVDTRSITEVKPDDVRRYTQVHLFAGIGGWSHALRLAGWDDDRPVWTGSCPCQPFSSAGRRKGTGDARHLWPDMFRLVRECRPSVVFGEQVASGDGLAWLDGVCADLEGADYAVGSADLCAAGAGEEAEGWVVRGGEVVYERVVVSPPHIRQRLWWVADAAGLPSPEHEHHAGKRSAGGEVNAADGRGAVSGLADPQGNGAPTISRPGKSLPERNGLVGWLGHADGSGPFPRGTSAAVPRYGGAALADGGTCGMGIADDEGLPTPQCQDLCGAGRREEGGATRQPGPTSDFWSAFDLIPCRDGKVRRVEPGTFPLAHGLPARVGRLRGYGNAINPHVAKVFIEATGLVDHPWHS